MLKAFQALRCAPPTPTRGFAVLVLWSDGSHTLECLSPDYWKARREIGRLRAFWRMGPIALDSAQVACVTTAEFEAHRQPCREACAW